MHDCRDCYRTSIQFCKYFLLSILWHVHSFSQFSYVFPTNNFRSPEAQYTNTVYWINCNCCNITRPVHCLFKWICDCCRIFCTVYSKNYNEDKYLLLLAPGRAMHSQEFPYQLILHCTVYLPVQQSYEQLLNMVLNCYSKSSFFIARLSLAKNVRTQA